MYSGHDLLSVEVSTVVRADGTTVSADSGAYNKSNKLLPIGNPVAITG
jgi:hypothetical protein